MARIIIHNINISQMAVGVALYLRYGHVDDPNSEFVATISEIIFDGGGRHGLVMVTDNWPDAPGNWMQFLLLPPIDMDGCSLFYIGNVLEVEHIPTQDVGKACCLHVAAA